MWFSIFSLRLFFSFCVIAYYFMVYWNYYNETSEVETLVPPHSYGLVEVLYNLVVI